MSELKWNWAYSPYLDAPNKQEESALEAGYVKVVNKDEADKVIAELKADYKEACDRLQTANLIKDEQLAAARHQKYKRCLKTASICILRARWFGDNFFYKKEQWALKWNRFWIKIAEQFKEAK